MYYIDIYLFINIYMCGGRKREGKGGGRYREREIVHVQASMLTRLPCSSEWVY